MKEPSDTVRTGITWGWEDVVCGALVAIFARAILPQNIAMHRVNRGTPDEAVIRVFDPADLLPLALGLLTWLIAVALGRAVRAGHISLPSRISWQNVGLSLVLLGLGAILVVAGDQLTRRDVPAIDVKVDQTEPSPPPNEGVPGSPVGLTRLEVTVRGIAPVGDLLAVRMVGLDSPLDRSSQCGSDASRNSEISQGTVLLNSTLGAGKDGTITGAYVVQVKTGAYAGICVEARLNQLWGRPVGTYVPLPMLLGAAD